MFGQPDHARTAAGGFTLLELMIVLTVIAILAAIAMPSYWRYTFRSNRAAAQACLAQVANYMERYYTTNLSYAKDTSGTEMSLPQLDCVAQTRGSYAYSFALAGTSFTTNAATTITAPASNPGQADYILQATPQGAQNQDTQCGNLAINQTGTQGITGTGTVQSCWK